MCNESVRRRIDEGGSYYCIDCTSKGVSTGCPRKTRTSTLLLQREVESLKISRAFFMIRNRPLMSFAFYMSLLVSARKRK